jgi:RNA polymerase sigma-70 factor (ECF subfamily)
VSSQDDLYVEAAAAYGAALARLAGGYERNAEQRRDLLQDIHMGLWQSLLQFDGRCSLRTWTYRVAHNIAISKILRRRSQRPTLVGLEELESRGEAADREQQFDRGRAMERLVALIHELKPMDRQVMLLYLDDLNGEEIGEVTGLSSANVATKIHRIKKLLAARFHQGEDDGN